MSFSLLGNRCMCNLQSVTSPNSIVPNLTANTVSPMPVLNMNPAILPVYNNPLAFALRAILAFALAYV